MKFFFLIKESHDAAKLTKSTCIIKVKGSDGKVVKMMNFSKEQWEEISDMHTCDLWSIETHKLLVIEAAVVCATKVLHSYKHIQKQKGSE